MNLLGFKGTLELSFQISPATCRTFNNSGEKLFSADLPRSLASFVHRLTVQSRHHIKKLHQDRISKERFCNDTASHCLLCFQ
ncbi:hypothetical protein SAMN05216334_1355 [Nitrosomonas ureae]|uniref:Uncharacterized protein n=1 Tax=Nitrosomonas ureae TaxID=44577 RepID=A0A1H5Y1Q5_9PROT|nr:hypothetical protein SAMN05216334_1355 [Nitrosomonas ureae]